MMTDNSRPSTKSTFGSNGRNRDGKNISRNLLQSRILCIYFPPIKDVQIIMAMVCHPLHRNPHLTYSLSNLFSLRLNKFIYAHSVERDA